MKSIENDFTPPLSPFSCSDKQGLTGLLGSGPRVIQNDQLYYFESYQYLFPKSKRKRIRKKWSTNKANYKSRKIWYCLLMGDDALHCPKWVLDRLDNGVADDCPVYCMPNPDLFSYQPPKFEYKPVDNGFKMSVSLDYYQVVKKPSAFIINNVVA